MGRHARTERLIEAARLVLAGRHPMTLRQLYYQLVSRQVLENTPSQYKALSKALVAARVEGLIPWAWVEDRLRRPRRVPLWPGLGAFLQTVRRSYRRDVWPDQPAYLECWLEKDALSGIFEELLGPYGVTLNVGRGYDGWSSLRDAAERYRAERRPVAVLYWGDFDPSGEDMLRSLAARLAACGARPELVKCALTAADVERYQLPPDPTKPGDSRRAAFVARHGDRAVELDALPDDVLRERLVAEVEARMDLRALAAVRRLERREQEELARLVGRYAGG